jgi:hypothetical protein
VLGTLAPVAAVVALVDRYRTAGPVMRQQIKWLLVRATISVALQAIPVQAIDSELVRTVAQVLVVLGVPLPLLAAAFAIFKHGLWEIDVVISKGLGCALVSEVLTALFFGVALVAGVTVAGERLAGGGSGGARAAGEPPAGTDMGDARAGRTAADDVLRAVAPAVQRPAPAPDVAWQPWCGRNAPRRTVRR